MAIRAPFRPTVEVKNSPVPFVIMGPGEMHRRVLVRSNDTNLDLVGLDTDVFADNFKNERWVFDLFSKDEGLNTNIVTGYASHEIDGLTDDERSSYLSFAWRGNADKVDIERIQHAFQRASVDVHRAIRFESVEAVEWQIAPLISLCSRAAIKSTRRKQSRNIAVGLVIIIYSVLLIAVFLRFTQSLVF